MINTDDSCLITWSNELWFCYSHSILLRWCCTLFSSPIVPTHFKVGNLHMETTNYFSRYPDFEVQTKTPAIDEFNRLSREMNWRRGSRKYRSELSKFLESEFAIHFGTDATKLENWQALCLELKIQIPIRSIKQCRKVGIIPRRLSSSSIFSCWICQALAKVHVNLVDLVDSRRTGKEVKQFASQKALREYTIETGKIFPKSAAKKDGFLKALLREIF